MSDPEETHASTISTLLLELTAPRCEILANHERTNTMSYTLHTQILRLLTQMHIYNECFGIVSPLALTLHPIGNQ